MAESVEIELKVIPANGAGIRKTTHIIEVEPTGVVLRAVLDHIKFDAKKMQVSVDGKVVENLETFIIHGAKVEVGPKPEPVKVAATEKAAGS